MNTRPFLSCSFALLLLTLGGHANPVDPGQAADVLARMAQWQKVLGDAKANHEDVDEAYKALKKTELGKAKTMEQHQQDLDILAAAYKNVAGNKQPGDGWLQVRQTSEGPTYAKSAQLSFSRTNGQNVYSVKAAFIIGNFTTEVGDYDLDYWFGNDFDLSSDTTKNPGKISNRLAAWLHPRRSYGGQDSDGWKGWDFFPSFTHEANRNFKTKALVGQFLAQPAFKSGDFALNWRQDLGALGSTEFGPAFGFEAGSAVDKTKGKSPEDGGFVRGVLLLKLNFRPRFAADKLTIYAENTTRWLGDDHAHTYNLFSGGLEYEIAKPFSLTCTYKIGRDSPKFAMSSELTAGIGVKY